MFCTTKEMVSKLKRPTTEWEKIFASYTLDKGLITRIYRELKKLNSTKTNEPIKKWATKLKIKSPKKLDSIFCPQCRETKADTLKQLRPIRKGDQELEKSLVLQELT
jgi:hypothetical protein